MNCRRRPTLRDVFEKVPCLYQSDYDGRGFEVSPAAGEEGGHECGDCAVDPCGGSSQTYEEVHVANPRPKCVVASSVESEADDELYRQREDEHHNIVDA